MIKFSRNLEVWSLKIYCPEELALRAITDFIFLGAESNRDWMACTEATVRPRLTRAISPKPWSLGGRLSVCQSWCCGFVTDPRLLVAATGEPLSPYLFILFINDLISTFDCSDIPGIYLPKHGNTHLLLYADDIVLIGESKNNLQLKINMIRKYFEENLLTLNENKSKIIVFRNGGKRSKSDNWYWGQQTLNVTERYMYLGYPLTSTNYFKQAALYYKGKALAASGAVEDDSFISSMKLLDAMVLSTLLYAAPVWANEHTLMVDQIQDSFMRRYLNLPRYT
ncbi:hypothetical protein LAZ67_3004756 [Cordylochernes scorpioides]|uniref:Reverse transcriptase domain-containing protein n=1 Tax=Cordylochernes scorpioides TaxID=51811 RepID=A0ABY6KA34_9ARAC|nr:hypothetical protein LAZ67_3004756 [Cordylochernes scorpioides]